MKSIGPIVQAAVLDELDRVGVDKDVFEAAGADWGWEEWTGGVLATVSVMPHPTSSMFPTSTRPPNVHGFTIVSARSRPVRVLTE